MASEAFLPLSEFSEQLGEVEVLDVGTGNGQRISIEAKETDGLVIGVDIAPGRDSDVIKNEDVMMLARDCPTLAPPFLGAMDKQFMGSSVPSSVRKQIAHCSFADFLATMPDSTHNKLKRVIIEAPQVNLLFPGEIKAQMVTDMNRVFGDETEIMVQADEDSADQIRVLMETAGFEETSRVNTYKEWQEKRVDLKRQTNARIFCIWGQHYADLVHNNPGVPMFGTKFKKTR